MANHVVCSTAAAEVGNCFASFAMDYSMNKIAKYFRMLGYDTLCTPELHQSELMRIASHEGRTIVTCSRSFFSQIEAVNQRMANAQSTEATQAVATRHVVAYDSDGESIYSEESSMAERPLQCFYVHQWRSKEFAAVMVELIRLAHLTYDHTRVFSRCVLCNDLLTPISKQAAEDRVVRRIYQTYDEFTECPSCRKIFWGFDGQNVVNFKTLRTLNLLRSLCIAAGAPVALQQTRLLHLRAFRSFPRLTKIIIFSFLSEEDLREVTSLFPALDELAAEVLRSRKTGAPVERVKYTSR